jgi:hypothetical protein
LSSPLEYDSSRICDTADRPVSELPAPVSISLRRLAYRGSSDCKEGHRNKKIGSAIGTPYFLRLHQFLYSTGFAPCGGSVGIGAWPGTFSGGNGPGGGTVM